MKNSSRIRGALLLHYKSHHLRHTSLWQGAIVAGYVIHHVSRHTDEPFNPIADFLSRVTDWTAAFDKEKKRGGKKTVKVKYIYIGEKKKTRKIVQLNRLANSPAVDFLLLHNSISFLENLTYSSSYQYLITWFNFLSKKCMKFKQCVIHRAIKIKWSNFSSSDLFIGLSKFCYWINCHSIQFIHRAEIVQKTANNSIFHWICFQKVTFKSVQILK